MSASAVRVPSTDSPTPWSVAVRQGLRRARRRVRDSTLPRRWAILLEMRQNGRAHRSEEADARARGASRDDLQGIDASWAHEYWTLEEEYEQIESHRLLKRLDRLMLSNPAGFAIEGHPNWKE